MTEVECQACTAFRIQRSQLIEDVSLALGEVSKLQRLNDFYKERIRLMEASGIPRPSTGGPLQHRKPSDVHHESNENGSTGVAVASLTSQQIEATLMDLRSSLKAQRSENQMLRQQRDDFALQVKELNQKLEVEIAAVADRAEARLASMRSSSSEKADFEDEFKELKRLRVLMRFSELKKDSDKLQETFQYVSKLEIENAGLKTQVERLLSLKCPPQSRLDETPTSLQHSDTTSKLAPPARPRTSGSVHSSSSSLPHNPSSRPDISSTLMHKSSVQKEDELLIRTDDSILGDGSDIDAIDYVYADGVAVGQKPSKDLRVENKHPSAIDTLTVGKSFGLTSPFGHNTRFGAVRSTEPSISQTTPRPASLRDGASLPKASPIISSAVAAHAARPVSSTRSRVAAPTSNVSQPTLKKELTTAQALLEMLNARPLVGAGMYAARRGGGRPQTAGAPSR